MGGMGFIERFRIECLRSILINTHMIEAAYRAGAQRFFFASSACAYNTTLQEEKSQPGFERIRCLPRHGRTRIRLGKTRQRNVLSGILVGTKNEDRHRPLPQCLRTARHVARRSRKSARGHVSKSDRSEGQRKAGNQHLGRWQPDPQLHVHRRLHQGHRHDHPQRRPDRHAHQPGFKRTGVDQRASRLGGKNRRNEIEAHVRFVRTPKVSRAETATTR